MPRKKPIPSATPSPLRRLPRAVAYFLAAAAVLAGIIVVGRWGLEQIRGHDRYRMALADIECPVPPGLTRAEFLDEVQYVSRLPSHLSILDAELAQRLTGAFARHPWVRNVEGVLVEPPRRVAVLLQLRRPVLAVRTDEGVVAVDEDGVRLPKNAVTKGLPLFVGNAPPSQGPAGTRWGDPEVEKQARAATRSTNDTTP